MRVKYAANDGSRSGILQEATVRFEGGKLSAVDIESFDFMTVGPTDFEY